MEKSSSIVNVAKALIIFHAKVTKVSKDASNPFFKSKYASLSNILEAISTPLQESGLTFAQFPTNGNSLTTILIHAESGEYMQDTYEMRPTKDDPQGKGSAITYQRRYALAAILGLNIDEDDDGNAASTPAKKQQEPQDTTMYNHKEIGTKEKPLITNENFKKAMALVKEDASIYEKTKNKYTLTSFQDEQLYELSKQNKSKLQTA
jgi:hypothetical protein